MFNYDLFDMIYAIRKRINASANRRENLGQWMDIVKWDQCKLIYITMPKTANTSIKTDISRVCGILDSTDEAALSEDPQRIHGLLRGKEHVAVNISELQKYKDYFIFSTVRNPFDRFVSFYNDKVRSQGWDEHTTADIFNAYGLSVDRSDDRNIQKICSFPDKLSEIHFRSQYSILCDKGSFLPHAVFRFEQMDLMWKLLRAYTAKFGIKLPDQPKHINKRSSNTDIRSVSQKAETIIRRRYAKDIEFFGY